MNLYEASNKGRIRRGQPGVNTYVGRVVKQCERTDGYMIVSICKDGKSKTHYVAKLVAEAFLGPVEKGLEVDHIDRNPRNNNLSNLRYLERKKNRQRAVVSIPRSEATFAGEDLARQIKALKGKLSRAKIAKKFDLPHYTVTRILRGVTYKDVA